jgi:hypothetical protein
MRPGPNVLLCTVGEQSMVYFARVFHHMSYESWERKHE